MGKWQLESNNKKHKQIRLARLKEEMTDLVSQNNSHKGQIQISNASTYEWDTFYIFFKHIISLFNYFGKSQHVEQQYFFNSSLLKQHIQEY